MIYGADVADLRRLAEEFSQGAETLGSLPKAIDAQLGSCLWVGPNADRFREAWSNQPRAILMRAAAALATAGKSVAGNADEQEEASSADTPGAAAAGLAPGLSGAVPESGGMSSLGGVTPMAFPGTPAPLAPGGDPNESDYLGDEMMALRNSIPSVHAPSRDVHQWWSSLSPKRQEELLKAWPVDIYRLKGIPQEVRKKLEGDGPYNRMEMVDYAIKNWDDESTDLFKVNCANYVSHAMEAGGMKHTPDWGYGGDKPWYEEGRDFLGLDKAARDTNVTEAWSNANAQRDLWVAGGHKPIPRSEAMPGDVFYIDYGKDGGINHAMIIRPIGPPAPAPSQSPGPSPTIPPRR